MYFLGLIWHKCPSPKIATADDFYSCKIWVVSPSTNELSILTTQMRHMIKKLKIYLKFYSFISLKNFDFKVFILLEKKTIFYSMPNENKYFKFKLIKNVYKSTHFSHKCGSIKSSMSLNLISFLLFVRSWFLTLECIQNAQYFYEQIQYVQVQIHDTYDVLLGAQIFHVHLSVIDYEAGEHKCAQNGMNHLRTFTYTPK
jgi:hypothetical protein